MTVIFVSIKFSQKKKQSNGRYEALEGSSPDGISTHLTSSNGVNGYGSLVVQNGNVEYQNGISY